MKTSTFIIIIIIASNLSCIRFTKKVQSATIIHQTGGEMFPYLISNHKLGTVSIGNGIDSTLKKLTIWFNIHNDSIPACDGCPEYSKIKRVYSRDKNQFLFSIEPGWKEDDKNRISRIMTTCEIFKTDIGIQVGMTVKKLKSECEITDVDESGETGIHISTKNFKGSFGLELPRTDKWTRYTPNSIPDSLRITEIIIV